MGKTFSGVIENIPIDKIKKLCNTNQIRFLIILSLPPFPQKFEGTIFTEIMPQFIQEVKPKKLVELGAIVI